MIGSLEIALCSLEVILSLILLFFSSDEQSTSQQTGIDASAITPVFTVAGNGHIHSKAGTLALIVMLKYIYPNICKIVSYFHFSCHWSDNKHLNTSWKCNCYTLPNPPAIPDADLDACHSVYERCSLWLDKVCHQPSRQCSNSTNHSVCCSKRLAADWHR